MAQHDYVIANGTGAAVRSDLNNALAAIVSQNSGASAPATTYAYQWWADTSTNLLKLRNGANSSFITVGDLTATNLGLAALASPTFTGTVTIPTATISTGAGIPLASAASPAIYFTGDTNTGIYSPGADQFAITTGGSGRVFVDSSGRVGLGTSAPAGKAMILGSDTTSFGTITNGALNLGTTNGTTNGRYVNLNFGYDTGATNAPASIGFTYTAQTGTGAGSLQFGTRSVTTDTAPDVRMTITSAGNVGIGTTGPSQALEVNGSIRLNNDLLYADATATRGRIYADSTGLVVRADTGLALRFHADAGEKARIDTSGRLLVGTSTSAAYGIEAKVQIAGTTDAHMSLVRHTDNAFTPTFNFVKSRGTIGSPTIVNVNDQLGTLNFAGYDGTDYTSFAAHIRCEVDGTPGADDMPGRLVFSTTADGASSPTERMRIHSDGSVTMGTTDLSGILSGGFALYSNASSDNHMRVNNTNSSFASGTIYISTVAAGTGTSFDYIGLYKDTDKDFGLGGDGTGRCDGSWTGGGADYAEYFEWSDGNTTAEDRRGISVVLDGDKIREAIAGEDPIGVISGNPSVVGDAAWNKWSGKHLRDEYGSYIMEEFEAVDDDGNTSIQKRWILNPDFDPDQKYVSREQRPEWGCVGLLGKLRIRKGQVTGARWIKMRDISDSVEEWLVR
jgi:hypothetical protein